MRSNRTLGMRKTTFITAVRARSARIAAGASAVRGQGSGCGAAARRFLADIDLHRFRIHSAVGFRSRLDEVTEELRSALPRASRTWGISRKLLNIFLRDSLYTTYLATEYRLDRVEDYLEIPLDSITASRIKEIAGRRALPAWPGVKNLRADLSDRLQVVAEVEARRFGLARVHLDTFWWGQRSAT